MKSPMNWKFTKMVATGNDFLLTHRQTLPTSFDGKRLSPLLCDRRSGLGADGLLILTPGVSDREWHWDFYNSDGSTAEMCGNAARCAALWCQQYTSGQTEFLFTTLSGIVGARMISPNMVEVTMSDTQVDPLHRQVQEHGYLFQLVNSGVPQAVAELKHLLPKDDLKSIARTLRHNSAWGSAGANITFYERLGAHHIKVITYERGVEDFTPSCGTGAVAAALASNSFNFQPVHIEIEVPGGHLSVDLEGPRPKLIGPAEFVAEMIPTHRLQGELQL